MGPIVAFILTIAAINSATASKIDFFTTGKEVVFNYESHVTVRTDQPASYASLYELQAKVHVQKNEEDTLMVRLDNIVFDLENGPMQESVTNHVYVTIPKEAEALSLPFAIKYDSNKLVTAVMVDSNDQEWSYNIKKSIASIFQFNTEVVSTFGTTWNNAGHVEYSSEQTIYGLCNVTYDVLPLDDHIMVIKTADPRQCGDNYNLKRNANFLDVDSNRIYKINQMDKNARIEMIEARGDIVDAQFRATTEMISLKVHQRFIFVEEIAVTNPLVINNQMVLRSLKYEDPLSKCRDGPIMAHVDITGGRAKYNNDLIIPKVITWLGEFVNFIHENHITLTKVDSKGLQLLQSLFAVLENFDLNTLEHTFALFKEQSQNKPNELRTFNVFIQLLPHVGTRSSAVFIRNLIRKQKLDETMVVRLLRDLPTHVRCPNEKLLIELEDMLEFGEEGGRVHRASVLAYASLIKRTYFRVDENSIVLDKFMKLFMQKLQSSQDYNIQVLYLHALGNIGMESVIHTLAPILTGKMVVDRNLRSLALWSVAPLFQKNPSLMIKLVWPILSDRELDISLRIAAYDIYVRTENPTLNRFMQLYWLMYHETNEHLYNFHYNTLETFTQITYAPKNENQISEIARAILRMSRRPIVTYSYEGISINDFIDEKSGLGGKIDNLFLFGKGLTFRTKVMSRVYGFDTEMLSLHVGIAAPNYAKINAKDSVTKYVEFIMRHEGRVVMTYVIAQQTRNILPNIAKDLGFIDIDAKEDKIIEIPYLYERIIPTDFGVPIRMSEMLPHIQSIYFKMYANKKGTMKFSFQIMSMTMHNTEFKVYNPINDLWHGIEKNKYINLKFGVNVTLEIYPFNRFKLELSKLSSDNINGMQVFNENIVFIKGEKAQEVLVQSHKDNLVRRSIIRGDAYSTNTVVYDTECKTLGQHVEVKIFDCDRDLSRGGLITRLREINIIEDKHDDFISIEFLRLYLSELFQSGYGSCGYGVRFTPLDTLDHMEFNLILGPPREKIQWMETNPFGFQIEVHGVTKSVQNTNFATYNTSLMLLISAPERKTALKWSITHNDQVNKERKLGIDLRYQMKEDNLDSKFILSLGEVDKLGVINFDIKGTRSEEQERILKERKITYNECRPEVVSKWNFAPVPLECAVAHSNLNRYAIDVTVNDVELEMVQMVLNHFNALRYLYSMYSQRNTKTETNVMPMHLDVVYPVFRKEWDVTIDTPRYTEVYTGIPRHFWDYWSMETHMSLTNIFFTLSKWDSIARGVNSMVHCVISKEYVLTLNGDTEKYELTNDWTLYLNGSTLKKEMFNVYVKKVDGNMPLAIQIQMGKELMEIMPQGHEFVIKVNNNVITPTVGKYTTESKWNYLMVESPKMIMFSTIEPRKGFQVIYDGRTIRTMIPESQKRNFDGPCKDQTSHNQFELNKILAI
ncbi:uncharacterized protein LOC123290638 [Chrysoperla carnea]|uniref:uncharacterized protein LOC123290638 n=1 Tax=Chrysoperla carnea TaxID=189513 RepID=UPI001D093D44|nr:uncharacterized protein LOC123290638 [Chrysoperla carnea]